MRLIWTSSLSKGCLFDQLRRSFDGRYGHLTRGSKSHVLRRQSASLLRPAPLDFGAKRLNSTPVSMTSRAVLFSLRSVRFPRVLFNGRRWRFLDTVAFYAGRSCPQTRFMSHSDGTQSRKNCLQQFRASTDGHTFHCSKSVVEMETEYSVEVSSEGHPLGNNRSLIMTLATDLQEDAMRAMKELVSWHQRMHLLYQGKESIELSLILSDDCHIQQLNKKYLNVDSPTDVLSFPMDGGGEDDLPVMLLGDIVLSLDTAERQARQMGHDLHTECRILLVHALLHLFGYDHDRNEQGWAEMAEMEKRTLATLGWKGTGLISNTKRMMLRDDIDPPTPAHDRAEKDSKIRNGSTFEPIVKSATRNSPNVTISTQEDKVQLVALDMDGTLLTTDQRITDTTKEVIEEAIERGIEVVIATGKARPGAIAACQKFGLYGERTLISHQSAGVFLQGLVVHTLTGEPMDGPSLSTAVVRSAFDYALETGTSCVAFTGDECVTMKRTQDVLDLHEQCFEPLAKEVNSIEKVLEGRAVKKIVMISDPESIRDVIQPYWNSGLKNTDAVTTMAVSNMLEVVPRGMNKWIGLDSLLKSMNLSPHSCMAVGDGRNDYEMIKNVGVGVAMGNAVDEVKSVADLVVSSNDNDGIVEAFEKLILS